MLCLCFLYFSFAIAWTARTHNCNLMCERRHKMRHSDDIISRRRPGVRWVTVTSWVFWAEKEETERREQTRLEELCNMNPTQQTRKGVFLFFLPICSVHCIHSVSVCLRWLFRSTFTWGKKRVHLKHTGTQAYCLKHTLKSTHTHAGMYIHTHSSPTYKQSFLRTGNPSTHVPVLLGNQSSVTVCMPSPLKTHKQVDRKLHKLLELCSFKHTHTLDNRAKPEQADTRHSCPPIHQRWIHTKYYFTAYKHKTLFHYL